MFFRGIGKSLVLTSTTEYSSGKESRMSETNKLQKFLRYLPAKTMNVKIDIIKNSCKETHVITLTRISVDS